MSFFNTPNYFPTLIYQNRRTDIKNIPNIMRRETDLKWSRSRMAGYRCTGDKPLWWVGRCNVIGYLSEIILPFEEMLGSAVSTLGQLWLEGLTSLYIGLHRINLLMAGVELNKTCLASFASENKGYSIQWRYTCLKRNKNNNINTNDCLFNSVCLLASWDNIWYYVPRTSVPVRPNSYKFNTHA